MIHPHEATDYQAATNGKLKKKWQRLDELNITCTPLVALKEDIINFSTGEYNKNERDTRRERVYLQTRSIWEIFLPIIWMYIRIWIEVFERTSNSKHFANSLASESQFWEWIGRCQQLQHQQEQEQEVYLMEDTSEWRCVKRCLPMAKCYYKWIKLLLFVVMIQTSLTGGTIEKAWKQSSHLDRLTCFPTYKYKLNWNLTERQPRQIEFQWRIHDITHELMSQ